MNNGNRNFWGEGARWLAIGLLCAGVASCSTTTKKTTERRHGKEYFSEKEYGVKASPRLYTGRTVPKGGGRDLVGKPYKVKGKWYTPKEDKSYDKTGLASWYGSAFHGRLTANGEIYDQYHLSAAHPTFPLPSYARVTNLTTGDSVIVRVNDRGPYHPGRIIDVSNKAAELLDIQHHGTARVRVQYVGRARMDGRDMPYLMASYTRKGERLQRFNPNGEIATGVMVASADQTIGLPEANPVRRLDAVSTATALQADDARSTSGLDALTQFVMLPEIGPVPTERPVMLRATNGALSAYAETRVRDASGPFDLILTTAALKNQKTLRDAMLKRRAGQP